MKKYIFISLLFLIACCTGSTADTDDSIITYNEKRCINHQSMFSDNVKTMEYDGCEYVIFYGYRETSITHKGNCKNLIHQQL